MVDLELSPNGKVRLVGVVDAPLSAAAMWDLLSDIRTFATHDPFHREFRVADPIGPGSPVVISHRFGVVRFDRVGQILKWEEGRAIAFSDLSARGRQVGFPHIYRYSLEAREPTKTRLTLEITGRWTARWIPRWVARTWLKLVMEAAVKRLERRVQS